MKKIITALTLLTSFLFASPTFAYTVQKGDTMTQIATKSHMTLDQLAELNPQVKDLNLIFVNQNINTTPEEAKAYEMTYKELKIPTDNTYESATVKTETPASPAVPAVNKPAELPKQPAAPESAKAYSDAEIDLLARLVRAEAQAEPLQGKIAVACVVLNRVESPRFPDSIRGVIYQRGQFSPVNNGQINKPADADSIAAVKAALTESRNLVQGSLFFYNPSIASSHWLDSKATTVVIGHHVFKK